MADGRPGPELKGNETRVVVSGRFEPTMLAELRDLTGLPFVEFVERTHAILKVVSQHRQAKAQMRDDVIARLEALLVKPAA